MSNGTRQGPTPRDQVLPQITRDKVNRLGRRTLDKWDEMKKARRSKYFDEVMEEHAKELELSQEELAYCLGWSEANKALSDADFKKSVDKLAHETGTVQSG